MERGLDKNQLKLRLVTQSHDLHKLDVDVTTTRSGLSCKIPHLGGEEVLVLAKGNWICHLG